MFRINSRPIRTVLRWQFIATVVLAGLAAATLGMHGALSAALGGLVSICAWLGFAAVARPRRTATPGLVVVTALRAEAVKVLIVVALLWLVLSTYRDVIAPVLIGSFVVSVVLSSMAFFVRDEV